MPCMAFNYFPHLGCQSEIVLLVNRVSPVPSGWMM